MGYLAEARFLCLHCLVLVAACLPAQGAGTQSPNAKRVLPKWLTVRAEHRTRYETVDQRYQPDESGGDQQFGFRTRLQLGAASKRLFSFAEVQDARVWLTDSGSTLDARHSTGTKFLQLHAGVRLPSLFGSGVSAEAGAGRFTRDLGSRRLMARNLFRNTPNTFDGVFGSISSGPWSVRGLFARPNVYFYGGARDPEFRDLRFGVVHATRSPRQGSSAEAYFFYLNDGESQPALTRRNLRTPGFRIFRQFGSDGRVEVEHEMALQWGRVGGRQHRAWMQHSHAGYRWPDVKLKPGALVLYDYASGDRDPNDTRSGTFDPLFGARRWEFGPTGIFGMIGRSNVRTPGARLTLDPREAVDFTFTFRVVRLAAKRDFFTTKDLIDPSGASGNKVGAQTEFRLRYRWRKYFEFDGGAAIFHEGAFLRSRKPSPPGRAVYFFAGTEWVF